MRLGEPPELGERVAVVGAGDVAMDVARTAVRLGSEVHVYYRRRRQDATAAEQEMRHAAEEGVVLHFQTSPTEIVGDGNGRLRGVRCVETEPGIKNASATNVGKPATTNTGLIVTVPPFINLGDKIKVDTDTGNYIERYNA